MAPTADTVCLVHCKQRDIPFSQGLPEFVFAEPLGGDIQQFESTVREVLISLVPLAACQGRIDVRRVHPPGD